MTTIPLLPAPKIAGLLPAPRQPHERLIERIIQLDPNPQSKSFWQRVGDTLDTVGDAEELIAKYMRKHLHKADLLWDSFMLIRPHGPMWESSPIARQLHMAELLSRVVREADLAPPTRVEIAMTAVALALKEGYVTTDNIPSLDVVIPRLELLPLDDLRKLRELTPVFERPTPDPERWWTSVRDDVRRATLGNQYDHYMTTYWPKPAAKPKLVPVSAPVPAPVPILPPVDTHAPAQQLQLL